MLKEKLQTKKLYKYGSCIAESKRIYKYFKKRGLYPLMVEGYAEIDIANDILPDEEFLMRFFPDEIKKLDDINYFNYPKVIQHTWVEVNNHIIDITRSQFDKYGSVIKYHILERYNI